VRNIILQTDAQVYAVVIANPQEAREGADKVVNFGFLKSLCNSSGAEAYETDSILTLPNVMARISSNLQSEYALGYVPAGGLRHDGKWRSIKLKVDVPRTLRPAQVLARSGYFDTKLQ
jgi:Ca-activated chloride channel family protein